MDENIYLVGFMGTGKSTVGKIVADRLGREFIEMDQLIEKIDGLKITDIFAQKGEKYFRKLEKKVLRDISDKFGRIVSCGGGIMINKDNVGMLKASGKIICLEASPSVIYARTKNYSERPLLNTADPQKKILELLELRKPFYKQANFFVDTNNLMPDEIAGKIVSICHCG